MPRMQEERQLIKNHEKNFTHHLWTPSVNGKSLDQKYLKDPHLHFKSFDPLVWVSEKPSRSFRFRFWCDSSKPFLYNKLLSTLIVKTFFLCNNPCLFTHSTWKYCLTISVNNSVCLCYMNEIPYVHKPGMTPQNHKQQINKDFFWVAGIMSSH